MYLLVTYTVFKSCLNNLDSVPRGELISLAKQINQIYGNPCIQSQKINLVNFVKIQTVREEKNILVLRKKSFLNKIKSVLEKYNVSHKHGLSFYEI